MILWKRKLAKKDIWFQNVHLKNSSLAGTKLDLTVNAGIVEPWKWDPFTTFTQSCCLYLVCNKLVFTVKGSCHKTTTEFFGLCLSICWMVIDSYTEAFLPLCCIRIPINHLHIFIWSNLLFVAELALQWGSSGGFSL